MRCLALSGFDERVFLVAAIFVGIAVILAWVRAQTHFFGRRWFLWTFAAMLVWLAAVGLELGTEDPACRLLWAQAAWPGIALLPTAWTFFLIDYAFSRDDRRDRWKRTAAVAGPAAISLMAFTNPWHGLFYGPGAGIDPDSGVMVFDHGPLFHLSAAYLYLFLAGSMAVTALGAFRARHAYRAYFLLLVFITGLPLAGNIGYVAFGFTLSGADPTPFLFSFVLFAFTWLIFTNRIFDIATIAKETLFFRTPNPVVIVDLDGAVVAANAEARALLRPPGARTGGPVSDWPLLAGPAADLLGRGAPPAAPPLLETGGRSFELQATPIEKPLERARPVIGWILHLADITEARRRNRLLEQALATNERRLDDITHLQRELERQVRLDPLTGLLNRRTLAPQFDALTAEAGSTDRGVCVALLDIDHFKSINDRLGHAAGDEVLRRFAEQLRARTDAATPLFRIGGEEFLAMFPGPQSAARDRLEDLRVALAGDPLAAVAAGLRITFSAGLAQWPRDGADFDAVFKRADARLYAAKRLGRNRTVTADVSLAGGTDDRRSV